MQKCFYNQQNCSSKMTREHVISAAALHEAFGEPVRNVVSAEFLGEKILIDHEQCLKDVCDSSNPKLSHYDEAGSRLVSELVNGNSAHPITVTFTIYTLGWLIKTHLNFIRLIKDRELNQAYPVRQRIKSCLISGLPIPTSYYVLYAEGWEDNGKFWNAESDKKIQFINYRSIRFKTQRIVLSNLRVRNLDTILLIPSDEDYKRFEKRVQLVIDEVYATWGFGFQKIDIASMLKNKKLVVNKLLTADEIMKLIRR